MDLDRITEQVHQRERALCPDATDTAPQPEGNYPLETLLVALRRRHFAAEYERPGRSRVVRHTVLPRVVVGFLIGTGDHYLAIARSGCHWLLYDNGRVVDRHRALNVHLRPAHDPISPHALVDRLHTPPRALLRVIAKGPPA